MASTVATVNSVLPNMSAGRPGVVRRLLKQRMGVLSLVFLVPIILLSFLGPFVYKVSPVRADPINSNAVPSSEHWLGTDELGRDELARLLHGGRVTLLVGFVSMVVAVSAGLVVGGTAAYFGGWVEVVLMRLVDLFMAIPPMFLILVQLTVFGNSTTTVIVVVGISFWAQIARVVYADVLRFKNAPFVEASAALGAGHLRLLIRHLAPQVIPSTVVLGTLVVAWSILTSAALSYLGLGIQPPLASWGSMLQDAQSYIWLDPKLAVLPGVVISVTVLCFTLLGNALRDTLDPKSLQRPNR